MRLPSVYLASTSPRRQELLRQIGVEFEVIAIDIDESPIADEAPLAYVQRIANAKVQAGWAASSNPHRPVIAADTAVVASGKILGKPDNDVEAEAMLRLLSDRTHQVMSCVAVVMEGQIRCKTSINDVTFAPLDDDMIAWYIATEEGKDKAGSYAVQGLAAMWIEHITGSYSGIMGLPLRETYQLLKEQT